MDIDIFKLLKSQAIEVFGLLRVIHDFASARGLHQEAEHLKDYMEENKQVMSIINKQLAELEQTKGIFQPGLFDTIN